ncbi:MAG: Trk system potassium transporter TrkA [Acidimicrobiia bacterium]|nr:Trk system potassium transporter TrkA [Acidimicrobiia bacterium]
MYIIVVGAGEVGSHVADRLSREGHDVVIVEANDVRRRQLEEQLDVLVIGGSGTHPSTLREAGLSRAELLVAATTNDEANLVASMLAKQAGVANTIIRIEAPQLRAKDAEELRIASGADLVIDPDEETALEVLDLIQYPGASEVAVMANGEVIVVGARLPADAPLVGKQLSEIAAEFEPEWEFLVGAITRDHETIIPRSEHRLEANDLLRVICRRKSRKLTSELLGIDRSAARRILLLGGGRTAEILAEHLIQQGAQVTIIERDLERARNLAERLDHVLVLEGDITDSSLLDEADVREAEVVVALTGEDDANILACVYAKSVGAGETIAVAHRLELLTLLEEVGIDVALSPRTASANGVLRFVRGDVTAVTTFLQGDAEVIEIPVKEGSEADGSCISDLALPKEVLVGAIVRDGKATIARGRSVLRARDHLVMVAMPHAIDDATRLFG